MSRVAIAAISVCLAMFTSACGGSSAATTAEDDVTAADESALSESLAPVPDLNATVRSQIGVSSSEAQQLIDLVARIEKVARSTGWGENGSAPNGFGTLNEVDTAYRNQLIWSIGRKTLPPGHRPHYNSIYLQLIGQSQQGYGAILETHAGRYGRCKAHFAQKSAKTFGEMLTALESGVVQVEALGAGLDAATTATTVGHFECTAP